MFHIHSLPLPRLLTLAVCLWATLGTAQTAADNELPDEHTVTPEGAWCWFADPRALHYQSPDGDINRTFIGYIDTHGNIKATQIDHRANTRQEVLIRSWFQPDDHDNPTFLVLPDQRVMVFYSRHTDEPCFYYRVSRQPADITTLGDEKVLRTRDNTTYPSPFILSDDPDHIYLCWRGINWHPTIARLVMPDAQGNTGFDWGPHQLVQSTGARPYAKYTSNGKDRIYMAYTTGHPDNEMPNHVYLNYVDIGTRELKDLTGNSLSHIENGPHAVSKDPEYAQAHPAAVVANTSARNWVWEVTLDVEERPAVAMTQISEDKETHDYYLARWTGTEWQSTFLANGGGHFHQSPGLERCYSGGMAINRSNPSHVVCSVPVEGEYGTVYELVGYKVNQKGKVTKSVLTKNSEKNNVRPYFIQGTRRSHDIRLVWMQGDYYDWIVNNQRPMAYRTAIRSLSPLPKPAELTGALIDQYYNINPHRAEELFVKCDHFVFAINMATLKPYIMMSNGCIYESSNVLGTSDLWKRAPRATDGRWYTPELHRVFKLTITRNNKVIRTYINGMLDQTIFE